MKSTTFMVFLWVYSSPIFSKASIGSKQQENLPLKVVCAHKGAVVNLLESTILAFQEAIVPSVQWIEFALRLAAFPNFNHTAFFQSIQHQ